MWIIEHEKWGENEEVYVRDIVDTYENLVNYFNVLSLQNSQLKKRYQVIPRGTPLRHMIPLLEGETELYGIIRMLPTNVPTENV